MKRKALFGLLAAGAIVGGRPAARRATRKMSEHCADMSARCMQMADQFAGRGRVGKAHELPVESGPVGSVAGC